MKTLKIIPAIIIAFALSSCVSNKKYNEAMSGKASWEKKYSELQADYNNLQKDKQSLQASSSEELSTKQKALEDKERRMQELQSLITAQRDAIHNLKKEVCSALKCFTPDELSIEIRDGKLYVSMSDKLLFPSGSDVVNIRGKEAVSMLAAVLANSDLEIMVEGHTDNVPINSTRNKDNWDLSAHRATSVSRIMIDNGIPATRIIVSGRGEYHPLATNEDAVGRQQNRRTEIVLAPKLDKLWELTKEEETATNSQQ